jgi:hypothetical protein
MCVLNGKKREGEREGEGKIREREREREKVTDGRVYVFHQAKNMCKLTRPTCTRCVLCYTIPIHKYLSL